MECQLLICKANCLTLSLKKRHFSLKHFKFVGIDVSPDGNHPTMSLSIIYWITGPNKNLFPTWGASLVSSNFTARSSHTSRSASSHLGRSCCMNTCYVLDIYGPLQPQLHLMNYASVFFTTLAFVISITKSLPSCGPTFCPNVLARWFANLRMKTHPCDWLPNICLAMVLVSWYQPARAHSIPLPLVLGNHMAMNHTSICTFVKSLLETGPWTNVSICCLGIALSGSWTVTLLDFFFHTMAAISQSSNYRCVLWDGMSKLSIGQTTT